MARLEVGGRLLARNALLNFVGQGVSLVVGIATIPFIVRGLGTERFGLLSLAWVILGYFTVFDLGLGRATTRFTAEALGKGAEDRMPALVWTAVAAQVAVGLVGAGVLAAVTPLLVGQVLKIPSAMLKEAYATFYILALALPVILVSGSFMGVLEARQRFDLVNAVRVPSSALVFLLPVAGLALGLQLPGIVALIILSKVGALVGFILANLWLTPGLGRLSTQLALLPRILSYGGWISVSALVIPVCIYLDRFLIGSLLGMNAVAYYTAPYELVTRLLIIPASVASVLFPSFSGLFASGDVERLNASVTRSVKYLMAAMVPPVIVSLVFAEEILWIWLGKDFAMGSAMVLRLLSVAVLLNAVGYVPVSLLQGIGRPDVVAKYHLAELPAYAGVALLLIAQLGIRGAALAWLLRVGWAVPILFTIATRMAGMGWVTSTRDAIGYGFAVAASVLAVGLSFGVSGRWHPGIAGPLTAALLTGYAILMWFFAFDAVDRKLTNGIVGELLGRLKRGRRHA